MYKLKNKRLFCLVLFLSLFFIVSTLDTMVYAATPEVSADGAVLFDSLTGEVIYDKNKDKQFPPASTTKIMTALLTLEKTNLDDVVTISENCEFIDGSKIYIFEGEQIKVRDLLHALIKVSANDCAIALAEHISGTTENFSDLMTKRAKELGAINTTFKNPHGLYEEGHLTTANDLALIMQELMKHPEYKEFAETFSYDIQPTNKCSEPRPLWNQNRLLYPDDYFYYKNAESGKTGYTDEALHTFVASAVKGDRRLIAVFLHDNKKEFYKDAKTLFEYGFNNFEVMTPIKKGDLISTYNIPGTEINVPLIAKDNLYILKNNEKEEKLSEVTVDTGNLSNLGNTPIENDTILATAKISYGNKSYNVQLVNKEAFTPPAKKIETSITSLTKSTTFRVLFISIIVTIILFILLCIRVKKIRKKRRLMRKYNINPKYISKK